MSDTTKILVDLYGSEEDFLDEYQNDIAIKFLLDKRIDQKTLNVELELVK